MKKYKLGKARLSNWVSFVFFLMLLPIAAIIMLALNLALCFLTLAELFRQDSKRVVRIGRDLLKGENKDG